MGAGGSALAAFDVGASVASTTEGRPLWELKRATRKADSAPLTLLSLGAAAKTPARLALAKNAVKRLRTLRHPNILSFVEAVELPDGSDIYLLVEDVVPLDSVLSELRESPGALCWGLHQLATAVDFLHTKKLIHGFINIDNVYVTKAGDWKLGGLELCSELAQADAAIRQHAEVLPPRYASPELHAADWAALQAAPIHTLDSWMLGCTIREVFGGRISQPADVKTMASIPKPLQPAYKDLFALLPRVRITPAQLLKSPFFENEYIETLQFLETMSLKNSDDRDTFFKKLDKQLDQFLPRVSQFKILPQLVHAVDFGAGSARALGPIIRVGATLPEADYQRLVMPSVLKWFSSADRGVRVSLLQNLGGIVEHASRPMVNETIYTALENGFSDASPALRELTLRSMLVLVPKMDEALVNTNMLKHFARLQLDPEPGIRTNTTVCLGKLAPHLSDNTRKRVLINAFGRALKDPFAPARTAGVNALTATSLFYTAEEIAVRILPVLAPLMVDPVAAVRVLVAGAVRTFVSRAETLAAALPDAAAQAAAATQAAASAPAADESGWGVLSSLSKWSGSYATPTGTMSSGSALPAGAAVPPPATAAQPPSDGGSGVSLVTSAPTAPGLKLAVATAPSVPAGSGWADAELDLPDDDDDADDGPYEQWDTPSPAPASTAGVAVPASKSAATKSEDPEDWAAWAFTPAKGGSTVNRR